MVTARRDATLSADGGAVERGAMMRGVRALVAGLSFVLLTGVVWAGYAYRAGATPALAASEIAAERAPAGVRIRVEVVNTTGIRGLGRRATRALRDRGYDVVEVKSGSPKRDSTLV